MQDMRSVRLSLVSLKSVLIFKRCGFYGTDRIAESEESGVYFHVFETNCLLS